jgi:2-hydroxychromene-2-carboxylate isomerase
MSEQFKEQGGAATMDPNPLYRWLSSRLISWLVGDSRLQRNRARAERARQKKGSRHLVEYFHQVDDGYSHLAAQILQPFSERYDIDLICHLVPGPSGSNAAEPELLLALSRYDAQLIAPHYGLEFPSAAVEPQVSVIAVASRILAAQTLEGFVRNVVSVGAAVWASDQESLDKLSDQIGILSAADADLVVARGNARRDDLKHYSGAMFYYAGEWYWGVDRLYLLEKRLSALGLDRQPKQLGLADRPQIESGPLKSDGRLTLEMYPSLRSPYTAVRFDRTVELAKEMMVSLSVRPVLPMVMRGVPATREKGFYIFSDAAREAREAGVPFGNFYDPIGDPVRRCYSLYPWACEQGKGVELLSSFLNCAFAKGVNTNNNRGLKTVIEQAGLDWGVAATMVGQSGWEGQLEENRLAMYEAGLWGVPSYRLLDNNGKQLVAVWGQDRLWLIAKLIQQHLAKDS